MRGWSEVPKQGGRLMVWPPASHLSLGFDPQNPPDEPEEREMDTPSSLREAA